MFLEPEEIAILTGCKRRKDQIAFLKAKGYRYEVNKLGHLIVARGHVEHRLGVGVPPAPEPDYTVFARRA